MDKNIHALIDLAERQLRTTLDRQSCKSQVVSGRAFVRLFREGGYVWYRLEMYQFRPVDSIHVDADDFTTGPHGSCYDLDTGQVQVLLFPEGRVGLILSASD